MIYSCWQGRTWHLRHVGMALAKRALDPAMLSGRSQLWAMELTGGQGRRGHSRRKRRPVMTWAVITRALKTNGAQSESSEMALPSRWKAGASVAASSSGHPRHPDGNRPRAMRAAETRKRRRKAGRTPARGGRWLDAVGAAADAGCEARTWPTQESGQSWK